jgi:hypothetical protein
MHLALRVVLGLLCCGAPFALLLLVGVSVWWDKRVLRRAARRFACPTCGTVLGEAAVELADNLWRRHMQVLFERNPGVKLRIVRTLDAVCTQCGARFRFGRETRIFFRSDVALSFENE